MPKEKIIVQKNKKGERLDKFLVKKFPQFSRSLIQKNIKNNLILVNNKKASPHYALKENDEIEVKIQKIEKEISSKEINLTADKNIPLEIVFENKDFLIVNKSAGLVVHPSSTASIGTLTNALLAHYPLIARVGEDLLRPGIVHRLDKEVSGLLVIAKNQTAFDHLKKQFIERQIKKEYLALVCGQIHQNEGEINFGIKRSKKNPNLMAAVPVKTGRRAITYFEVVKKFVNYTLLKLTLKTGRTHQIRVHLKALGHPVVGDQLYKIKKYKEKIKLDRLFLHAETLGFFDLAGQWQEFHSPLPEELEEILKNLK